MADTEYTREQADKMVRYCPECGLIGPVPATHETCCPDSFGMQIRHWQAEKMERMLARLRAAIPAASLREQQALGEPFQQILMDNLEHLYDTAAPAPSSEGDEGSGGGKGEAARSDGDMALNLLDTLFTAYEEGVDVYEDPEECAGHMGHAVKLDEETFHACADLLNRTRPRGATPSFALSPTSPPNGKTADGVPACPTCRGEGEVDERIGGDPFAAHVATCPDCNGTGNAASRGGER